MKVASYYYQQNERLQFLYINGDYDRSQFPASVKNIIANGHGHDCSEAVITAFGYKIEELFKKNGYLLAPNVVFEESEGLL